MVKGLKLFFGVLVVFVLSGLTASSYASSPVTSYSFTFKQAPLKSAKQLTAGLADGVLHTGANFQLRPGHSPELHAELSGILQVKAPYTVFINAPQISATHTLLHHRFLLYPFHAFW